MKRSILRPALLAGLIVGCVAGYPAQAGADAVTGAAAGAVTGAAAGPVTGAVSGVMVGAAATTTPISAGARLAGTCAACHGTAGATAGRNGGGSAPIPSLAGQSREALSSSLRAFKAGTRQSTIMTQIAKGYTDEQIELLSAYFAAQKKGG